MARPDITKERTEQILDAFETCVARYGVEGATVAKTAEVAGLARPLVRHNVGNRDALLSALVARYIERSQSDLDAFIAALPTVNTVHTAIDWLFDRSHSDANFVQVANALIAASADDSALAAKMRGWLDEFTSRFHQLIADTYPQADPATVSAAAAGITGIYFNLEALYALGDVGAFSSSSKRAATMLVEILEKCQ
jgi:AcrR family transcriptional regulator